MPRVRASMQAPTPHIQRQAAGFKYRQHVHATFHAYTRVHTPQQFPVFLNREALRAPLHGMREVSFTQFANKQVAKMSRFKTQSHQK